MTVDVLLSKELEKAYYDPDKDRLKTLRTILDTLESYRDTIHKRNVQIKRLKADIADLKERGICTSENPCDCMVHNYR